MIRAFSISFLIKINNFKKIKKTADYFIYFKFENKFANLKNVVDINQTEDYYNSRKLKVDKKQSIINGKDSLKTAIL